MYACPHLLHLTKTLNIKNLFLKYW